MKVYQTKIRPIPGTDFREVHKKAFNLFKQLKSKSKRRAYVRSAYFNKNKVFLDIFWGHLFEKPNWRDRVRRVKYFPPGIDLIQNSRFEPKTKENPNKSGETLYRFAGMTSESELFYVQIKEDKKRQQKLLISIFPDK
ncbi:MAG: hypothetical protein NTZ25_01665 [Candidatus Peregrinibacteria bacterium]|nr:hypothetical protein [Candidatus Peregrinibacteria bacterium]